MRWVQGRLVGLLAVVAAVVMVSGLFAGNGFRAGAHDEDAAHPAHIHLGSCPTVGEVVFPLADVTQPGMGGSPTAMESTPVAEPMASPAAGMGEADVSTTTVQVALADIITGGHAINVHESAEAIQNYIACGNIVGTPTDGALEIDLAEQNDSGYSGQATLSDNGDGTTTVMIALNHDEAGMTGSPVTGDGSAVSIKDFAFNPGTIEVAVGTTITWTNDDAAPHTVSQSGGGFESGRLDPGTTFSFTFDTAGTFDYFCQFHANMTGQVVVS